MLPGDFLRDPSMTAIGAPRRWSHRRRTSANRRWNCARAGGHRGPSLPRSRYSPCAFCPPRRVASCPSRKRRGID